jgi:hypothetical protein
MSISRLMQMAAAGAGGEYQISRSLRFNSADSAYLSRTPASAGDRKTWTWSGWVKRVRMDQEVSANITTTQVFRDVSAWYHFVIAVDTTQATGSNRVKIYVNGLQITAFDDSNYPSQDFLTAINNNVAHEIGLRGYGPDLYLNSYLTEINFIDGQALTPSSFGETNETTGVWSPIQFNGPWNVGTGVNGFYLNFSDNSDVTAATLGADYSGNGNNWTPSGSPGFSVTAGAGNDSLVDTPTQYGTDTGAGGEVRGNYCTFNPLFKLGGTAALTWASNGNLQAKSDSSQSMIVFGTMGLSPSTKFYNEFTMTNVVENDDHVGIVTDIQAAADTGTCVAYKANGDKIVNGVASAYGASYTDNDVISIAVNLVDNEVTFYKNGASQGTITGVTSGTYFHRVRFNNAAGQQAEAIGNWGQRPFAYTAPSGFKALVTTNLPEPTVVQGDDYFNTVLWDGTGSNNKALQGVGFVPDFVGSKPRNAAGSHALYDAVRGVSKTVRKQHGYRRDNIGHIVWNMRLLLTAGFTVGALHLTQFKYNSLDNYVAWNWKADGAGVSNTAGTIPGTVTVSANTIAGISIVTYTGNWKLM